MSNNVMENVQTNTDIVEVKERSLLDKRELYINLKRGADIVISSLALVILLPFIAIISVLIKIDSKGKVFYKQTRIGKNGKYFTIYKFRTMVSDANNFSKYFTKEQMEKYKINYKLDNDPRITKMGKILRKTSLDELPQLINILKGDLSIIGPRPIVDGEIEKYGLNKNKLLSVTPGLTGNWAANGRSCTSYEERMQMELDYVENISFKMDMEIFFKTIICVFKRKGAM